MAVFFALLLILFLPLTNCKSHSTAPDVNDLTRPVIWVDDFNVTFAAYETGPNPASKVIKIKNSGQQTLDYTLSSEADWVEFSPEGGSSSGQIVEHTISINKSGLKAQKEDYTANITITSSQAYNNPQNVEVSLNLAEQPPPEIWISSQQLTFNAREGRSDPASQSIEIKNTGEGTLNYKIITHAAWLSVDPTSGTVKKGERSHTVSADIAGLKKGTYNGTITIKDPDATNSPQQIDVTLEISERSTPKPTPTPLTNNEVGIFINPSSGATGTTVTVTVSIKGNTSPIASAFGLNLKYDASILQYLNTSKGSLTSSWAAVDGGASAGTVTVGGFRGSGSVIATGSQGSIAVVRFRVIYNGATDRTTQINLSNLIDDLSGMIAKPAVVNFTYKH